MDNIRNIGFIGIGNMGAPMAGQLARKGFSLTVYDTHATTANAFAQEHGARVARSAAEVGIGADAVIFMLPSDQVVRQVLFTDGLATQLAPGSIAIDMGTSAPAVTRSISAELATLGIGYLDAPVMGGVVFAKDASLDIMVSGDDASIERCRPLFDAMGRKLWPCGDIGSAHVLKAMTNYINACALINTLEAMTIGRKFGLDSKVMAEAIDVMCNGRQHPVVKKIIPHVLTHKFGTGMAMQLIAKDVKIAVDSAHSVGAAVPLGEATEKLWRAACEQIGGSRDHSEIVKYWETASGVQL
ncbi:3-hydroxyisobutyrate dehydrogenase [Janthinobacterium sp. Marseille]|nr:NAD(P)-dependent oxidoreductase [Janthinobacterium sp. Marseille]ABR88914.1 3-hydroxyisobutyrate dehydrogenase [Janthinobacterium sp. Marseille]